jgi:hypothetical protein
VLKMSEELKDLIRADNLKLEDYSTLWMNQLVKIIDKMIRFTLEKHKEEFHAVE